MNAILQPLSIAFYPAWRHFRVRPGAAHLWGPIPGRLWQTACGRLRVIWLEEATEPLTVGEMKIQKCRLCVQHERRRKEAR